MKKSKTIAIFVDCFWPMSAGVGNATLAFAYGLKRAGWQVTVITPKRNPSLPTFENYLSIDIYRPWLGHWAEKKIRRWFYYCLFPFLVLPYLYKARPSYLFGQAAWAEGLMAVVGGKLTGGKSLVHTQAHPRYANSILFLAKLAYRHCDMITATADDYRKILNEEWLIKKPIYILPNAHYVPEEERLGQENKEALRQKLGWPGDRFHILNIGRMVMERESETKGMNFMIDAMAKIENGQLHLIGNGPLKSKYQKQAESLNLQNQVAFHGSVGHRQIMEFMQAADVLVMSSLHEGLSMAVLEALSVKLPIITTATSGVSTYLVPEQDALFIASRDSEAITSAVNRLIGDGDLRTKLANNGHLVYLGQFVPDKVAQKLEHIINTHEGSSL